jgi:hypothetical protein
VQPVLAQVGLAPPSNLVPDTRRQERRRLAVEEGEQGFHIPMRSRYFRSFARQSLNRNQRSTSSFSATSHFAHSPRHVLSSAQHCHWCRLGAPHRWHGTREIPRAV